MVQKKLVKAIAIIPNEETSYPKNIIRNHIEDKVNE